MKNALISAIALTASLWTLPTQAAPANPLIRVCRTAGGTFEVQPWGTDDIALCRFGHALIDSQSILSNLSGRTSAAARVILQDVTASSCGSVGASAHTGSTGETLCAFGDGSVLGLSVVGAGLSDSGRRNLKDGLLRR